MRRRIALTTTAWVAGAALATAAVTVALSVLGSDLLGSGGPVLSSAQVRADLAAQGPGSPAAAPRPGRRPAAPPGLGAAGNFSAGTVFAACLRHRATLTDWIPAQGYRTIGFSAGPASTVSVRFGSASAMLTVTVTCPRGRPVFLSSSAAPGSRATPASPTTPGGRATPAAPPATTPAPAPGQSGRGGGGPGGPGGPDGGGHGSDG